MHTGIAVVTLLLFGVAGASAQKAESSGPPPMPYPPVRLEVGGAGYDYGHAGGWWRDWDASILLRKSRWFVPTFSVDTRTSDAGSSRYYSFFSYANWTANFFTTQGVSGSGNEGPLLFPRFRYDVKAWWKAPPSRRVVAGIGFTQYRLRDGASGQIINPGVLYYRGPFVFDVEGFVNRSRPGGLWSGSGLLAIQQGREGRHWVGATLGGGRQVYKDLSLLPVEIRYHSVSVDLFYRQWLTRNFGFVLSGGYQDAFGNFQRYSVGGHLFVEF